MANDASINPEVAERIAEDKQKLLDALKELPFILHACRKTGVSPATYYRWRTEDKLFRREAKGAMTKGVEFVNDLTEYQLVSLIKEKKMPAVAFWLKHHHKQYGAGGRPATRQRRARASQRAEQRNPGEAKKKREELKTLAKQFHEFLKQNPQ